MSVPKAICSAQTAVQKSEQRRPNMKCNKCGAELKDTMKFCNKCGAKVTLEVPKMEQPQIQTHPSQPAEPVSQVTTPKVAQTTKIVEPKKVTEPPKVEKTAPVEAATVNSPSPANQPVAKPVENEKPAKEKKPVTPLKPKNKVVAGVLAILLGFFGIHWFYLGKPIRAIIYLVVYLVFPFVWLLYIIEGIYFLCAKPESFDKYRSFGF